MDGIYELHQGHYCRQQRSLMFLIGQVLYESLIFNIFGNKSYLFFIAQSLFMLSIYQLLYFKEKRLGSASNLKYF